MQSCVLRTETTIPTQQHNPTIAQLYHLLNGGKLTSITNNINSLGAPRGILLLGGPNVRLPTIIKQTSSPGPFHARVCSTCHTVVWKVSTASDVIVCNKFCNKVTVELACCCGNAGGKQTLRVEKKPSDKVYSYPKTLNEGCQVGSRWSTCHIRKYRCFQMVRFSPFTKHRPRF